MYTKDKALNMSVSTGMLTKNLQVVSFDADWKEIYLGTVRRNHFTAFCPNDVESAIEIDFKWMHEDEGPEAEQNSIVVITMAKWCPLDQCTVLVLGSQYGIKLYDWDGSTLIYYFDFVENGIGVDDRQIVEGAMARGVAALGANIIAVGIHTGTIVLFKVSTNGKSFQCSVFDTQRCHVHPITELASATVNDSDGTSREILVSGDVMSHINIWQMTDTALRLVKVIEPYGEFPVTVLTIWNKIPKGVIIAGYGSGHIRLFSIPRGAIVAEATAHAGWITGMDLANLSGLLITSSEDGFVRVWQMAQKGHIISHRFSASIPDCLLNGVKFLNNRGSRFAVTMYDSNKIQLFAM